MTIIMKDIKHYLRVLISPIDNPNDNKANYCVKIFGGFSFASSQVFLYDDEIEKIKQFLEDLPIGQLLIIARERIELKVESRPLLFGDSRVYLIFKLYDTVSKGSFTLIEFVAFDMERKSHCKDLSTRDFFVEDSDDCSSLNETYISHANMQTMKISIGLDNDHDEYYYAGHISVCSPFIIIDKDILIGLDEYEDLDCGINCFNSLGRPFSFSPMNDMIDITFTVHNGTRTVTGEISDAVLSPAVDYRFNYKLDSERIIR